MKFAQFILLFLVTFPILVNGQNNASFSQDTALVNSYLDSTRIYIYTDTKLSESFADKVDSISKAINYDYGQAQANLFYGVFSFMNNDFQESIYYYNKL